MNLFEVLPERYFSIFTSKNARIFAESILILFEMLESDESVINKNDFVRTLKEKGKSELDNLDLTLEEDATDEDGTYIVDNLSTKASFVVRRLEETGWINIAMDPETLDETIVLPVYSIYLLRAFKDIISDEETPYLSLVHATYSELKLEDEEQDELMYATLLKCYDNTKKLKVELVTLFHSIRIYQNKLGKMFETNDVLHDFLDVYKEKINDRYYHPLKTFDSVTKFKRPIISILENWLSNKEIRTKLIAQACLVSNKTNKEDIEQDIIAKINYITDTFSNINSLVSSIDKENSAYTKSSTNKILYLNNTDRSIKGHLENILKSYAKNVNNLSVLRKILTRMQDSIYFYEQGYIDPSSITLPIIRKARGDDVPLEIVNFDFANELIMRDFLESTKNVYTDERIYEFVENAFGGEDELKIEDLPLPNFEAFLCLIFATIKKDEPNCFYDIELVDDMKIVNNIYVVPHFLFRRKEKKDVH